MGQGRSRAAVQSILDARIFTQYALSRNHAQEMLSVIIPQIKQAISLATAVFAMFTFDRIAILKYFFFSRAFALLFHCVVHFRRNIYRAVSMESKALADQAGISAICLDTLAWLCHHRGRRKNYAVNTVSVQLMIQ